jgi:hypothetical protein
MKQNRHVRRFKFNNLNKQQIEQIRAFVQFADKQAGSRAHNFGNGFPLSRKQHRDNLVIGMLLLNNLDPDGFFGFKVIVDGPDGHTGALADFTHGCGSVALVDKQAVSSFNDIDAGFDAFFS